MRLIDAKQTKREITKYLEECIDNNKIEIDVTELQIRIFGIINNQPTAYDPEKVKKEIDRVGKSFCDYVACNEECTSCEHHSIMNAVTCVVRKGGV